VPQKKKKLLKINILKNNIMTDLWKNFWILWKTKFFCWKFFSSL